MNIIEQLLVGKHNSTDCEDGIVITPDFVAVIDGSTSKTTHKVHPFIKNGRYCMMAISDFIRRMSADLSLNQFCEQVTACIHNLYPADDTPMRTNPQERLCASAVVYSVQRHEIWMIGDCQCMVNGHAYQNDKPYESTLAHQRALAFKEAQQSHPDMVREGRIFHDYARDTILDPLIKSMAGENLTYAVIDGFPIFMPGVKTIPIIDSRAEIILASDGYPFLRPSLRESEAALFRQLTEDPFCIQSFVATKGVMAGNRSFDDRAYVRFRLSDAPPVGWGELSQDKRETS